MTKKQYQIVNNDNDILAEVSLPEGDPEAGNRSEEVIKKIAQEFANIFECEVFIDEMFAEVAIPLGIDPYYPRRSE